jgi:hypothetical protein
MMAMLFWLKPAKGGPIKIEGNPNDLLSKGGLSGQAQASVLTCMMCNRLKNPIKNGA